MTTKNLLNCNLNIQGLFVALFFNLAVNSANAQCVKPNAGSDVNVCPFTCTTLTGSPVGGTWSKSTDFAQTTSAILSSTSNGVATFCVPDNSVGGINNLIYTVGACSDTMQIWVALKPDAGNDSTVCAGSTVITKLGWGNAANHYALTSNPVGATFGTDPATGKVTVVFDPNASGVYGFVQTNYWCNDTVYYTVNQCTSCNKPNAGIDQYACGYSCITLTGTNTTAGTWSAMAGNPSTNITLSTTTNGIATACFNSNSAGFNYFIYTVGACTDTMMVEVIPKPNAGNDSTVCAGTTLQTLSLNIGQATSNYALSSNPAGANLYYVNNSGHYAIDFASTASGVYGFVKTDYWCSDTVYYTVNQCSCTKPNAGLDDSACAPLYGLIYTLRGTNPTTGVWTAQAGNPAPVTIAPNPWTQGAADATFPNDPTLHGDFYFIYTVGTCSDTVKIHVDSLPSKPSITGNTTVCNGDSVLLTATPGHLYYYWSQYITGSNHAFPISGLLTTNTIYVKDASNYYVGVSDKPNGYCTRTSDMFTISSIPVATCTAVSVCIGADATARVMSAVSPAGGTINWNGATATTATSYTYTITNSCGTTSCTNVIVRSGATISTTNVTVCSTTLPYIWNGTSYNAAGSYTIHLTNAAGCDSAAVLNLVVNTTCSPCVKPHVNFDWQYNGNCLTYDFNSTSWISAGWISSFYWDFGNGQTSTQSNPLATFPAAGTYNVKLVVTSNTGCKDSITYAVNIINKCTTNPSNCSASWYSQQATTNCDSTLRFIASGSNTSGATYTWSFGDGSTGTGTPAVHKYATTGSFTVKLVVTNGTCKDSVSYNVYVSSCNVTSGGGGGVESKTLGDVIAQRLYGNAKSSTTEVNGIINNQPFTAPTVHLDGVTDINLRNLVPASVIGTTVAKESTPTDLVNFTNAVEVLAIDYKTNNSIKAVAFGTKTYGDVYSHTKPICDRLKGAQLLEVKTIAVGSYNLTAYKVQQCTGEVEYAMNLSAGINNNDNNISLQSKWFTSSYAASSTMYNFQLWAVSYDMVKTMAQDIIAKLQANGNVTQAITTNDLPTAYITTGSRNKGTVTLNVQNNTTATTAIVELKEKATETSTETTRQVPVTIQPNANSTVTIDVKDSYEATMNLMINNAKADMVYLNDGTWSKDYDATKTTINNFTVTNEGTVANNADEYRLLRNINFNATTSDYVTAYKTIGTKCQALNLANYNNVKFNANATGASSVTVTLISNNITDWKEQYAKTISLNGNQEYAINLNDFISSKYNTPINASNNNTITGVSFAFNNGRGVTSTMTASLSNARFGKGAVATTSEQVTVAAYPNPSNGKFVLQFNKALTQDVRVRVLSVVGKEMITPVTLTSGTTTSKAISLNNNIANGMYMIVLEGDNANYAPIKLVVNR